MKTRLLFAPLLLALVASLAACGGGSQGVPANAVAVVGGTPITTAEFNSIFAQFVNGTVAQGGTKPTPGTAAYTALRDQAVAELVQIAEVKQQASKVGVSVSQTAVTKFLTNLAQTQYGGSMTKLTAALKAQGLSLQTAKQEVYINLLATKIKTKVTSTAKVTVAQEKAYFKSTPPAATRSVEHILVKSKSLADTIEQKLRNGESFAKLAKKYSKDSASAALGGKYTATEGSEVPAYDAAAFSLKTGVLSAPVDATSAANGSYGWFIIKALGPVQKKTFSEDQATIQQTLLQDAQNTLWQQWVSDLAKEYQGKVSYQSGYAPPTTTALSQTNATVTTG